MYSLTLRQIFSKYHGIEVGLYSYGGCFDPSRINPLTKIGRYCSFAEGVCIFNANHPIERKSMHPFFYNPASGCVGGDQVTRRQIVIGNDVWVGRNAIILPGCTRIGHGAVVGAGSVVTGDVPEFAIVAGNPARILRYRFSPEAASRLLNEKWWDKDIAELRCDMIAFSEPYEKDSR